MTVLAKTLFTLVGSHLVPLMLLSVWHNPKILEVLDLLFHLLCEALGGLESRNIVFGNGNRRILRDVAGNLLGALLHDEAAEATKIDIVILSERRLDALHESLNDSLHLHFLNSRAFRDFAYDICLCHNYMVFIEFNVEFGVQIYTLFRFPPIIQHFFHFFLGLLIATFTMR